MHAWAWMNVTHVLYATTHSDHTHLSESSRHMHQHKHYPKAMNTSMRVEHRCTQAHKLYLHAIHFGIIGIAVERKAEGRFVVHAVGQDTAVPQSRDFLVCVIRQLHHVVSFFFVCV
jgi:hypothetical protein